MNTALDILDKAAVFTPTVVHVEGFHTQVKVQRFWEGWCMYLSGRNEPHTSNEDEFLLPLVRLSTYRAQKQTYALWATWWCEQDFFPDMVMFVHQVGTYGIMACRKLTGPPRWAIPGRRQP